MPVDRSPTRTTKTSDADASGANVEDTQQGPKDDAQTTRIGGDAGNGAQGGYAACFAEIQANEFRNVKLTTFWRNRPKLWFVSLESEFTAYRVRSDDIKFSAVVRHLDEQTMLAVADVLEQPPSTGKYDKLKAVLIERFSDSLEKQLRTLLDGMDLGDKAPSVLLREMRTLAGANVTDNMLRTLWLQRLPTRIQELLTVLDDVSLDKLAACADKAHERGSGAGNTIAVVNNTQLDPLQTLQTQVQELTKAVAAIGRSRGRPHNRRARSQSRGRSASGNRSGICYYHRRYKEKAWKCLQPCTSEHPLAKRENPEDRRQ